MTVAAAFTRRPGSGRLSSSVLAVVLLCASARAATDPSRDQAPSAAGCYQVVLGPLRMPDGKAATAPDPGPPPARIRLSSAAPSPAERERHFVPDGLAVVPHGAPATHWLYALGAWTIRGDGRLHLHWNGGFSGVEIDAERRGTDWVGTLTHRTDEVGPPRPSAPVTLTPYSCE